MNIDTTAINPASATTLLPIPCLPFSPLHPTALTVPLRQLSFKPLKLGRQR
jgi:hypothetical protein